jgi:hypothetical protein
MPACKLLVVSLFHQWGLAHPEYPSTHVPEPGRWPGC